MRHFKKWAFSLAALSILAITVGCQQAENPTTPSINVAQPQSMQAFAYTNVRLTTGPFAHAQQVNVQYLLALEPDKLLAPYLREAGMQGKSESYGNWENTGLDGHIGGHYLTALSLAYATTGDEALAQRLDYMLAHLHIAQKKNNGYLSGIPDGLAMWQEIAKGEVRADLFSLNERWVPLYNIDKTFHGLRDAYEIAGKEQAKPMLLALGEWMLDITKNLTDEQVQSMLYSEHGGLNDVFADMARISGDHRYVRLAERFTHNRIIEPLAQQKDELTGLHANTQIPKIIGALKVAEQTDDKAWQQAAEYFWQTVTQKRSVSIGGNSVREHFHSSDDFTPMIEDIEGPETCNTYNMVKLSKLLFLQTADTRYLEFYERATYNHILSSQHPEHGGLVYFTSMRPGHYRMYSSVHDSMWCCVGSGIENHSKYGELVFTHTNSELAVNLFIPSVVAWEQRKAVIEQVTEFPDDTSVTLRIKRLENAQSFTVKVRQPTWLNAPLTLQVNGSPINAEADENGYLSVNRVWQQGDELSFTLDAKLYTEQLPDGQNYYSVLYGPVVLATPVTAFKNEQLDFIADDSRMGHIAAGPTCPPEALPMMLDEPADFIAALVKEQSDSLAFIATDNLAIVDKTLAAKHTRLIPFFRIHDTRYQVYWPQIDSTNLDDFVRNANERAQHEAQLAAITVDAVNSGEQQPEVEHNFAGENTRAGVNNGQHWRDANGWFSYQLRNEALTANTLRIRYFKGDVDRHFAILVNGDLLVKESLPHANAASSSEFYTVDYPLTQVMASSKKLTVRFAAKYQSIAGGIYGVRLLAK
ncbi:beta-L-arabinofuranosidase domain-containing protein [Pseudoalteromonas pernae]|uniref:beta-L-arabinofuranosidase domain-containing protein n=1 Tax=Pseudoalteromonas pernae TaxID=3118054 RepID=UPI003241E921